MPIKRVGRVDPRGNTRTRRALQRTMLENVSGIDVLRGVDTIASASTCSIGLLTADLITITGTTTITSFGAADAGAQRDVIFAGVLTLTYNATSMILPTAASITTAAGDRASFRSDGQGNWVCIIYTLANGTILGIVPIPQGGTGKTTAVAGGDALCVQSSDITISSSTVDLSTATGSFVTLTASGSFTITSFGTANAGVRRTCLFAGGGLHTITYNSTSMILPHGSDLSVRAGDVIEVVSLGSGNWRCLYFLQNSIVINVTGGTTSDLLGVMAGITTSKHFIIRFTASITLTHSSSGLRLPSGADITTANGDVAYFQGYVFSGTWWQCISYTKADGTPVLPVAAAAQSDQETGTSTTLFVSPGRQQFHPSAAKAWTSYTSVTTTSAYSAYNCTLFDNGTGDTTITFTTAFSSANYSWSDGVGGGTSGNNYAIVAPYLVNPTASAFRVATGVVGVSLNDSLFVSLHFFGDQ